MDKLRNEIWDHLFRAREPISVEDIAQVFGQDQETVRKVVDHEWFAVSNNVVTVAFHAPAKPPTPATDDR